MSHPVVVGRHVAEGDPIVVASYDKGIYVATAAADEHEDPDDGEVFCCPACFAEERPEAEHILRAAHEHGWWHAE